VGLNLYGPVKCNIKAYRWEGIKFFGRTINGVFITMAPYFEFELINLNPENVKGLPKCKLDEAVFLEGVELWASRSCYDEAAIEYWK